ncbi:FecR domain-containing protein [Burkholderiaceae bacterium]|nr:FecR domain-containing protein [Burkholderiaceae bacterium]MDC0112858.1 FecR domain-containing protein [Burkholderiaceae bacterium]
MKLVSLIFKFMIPMLITVLVNKISFAAEPAGLILKVSGETNILAASGELREATKKGLVYVGDTLKTAAKAQAFVMMNDKTRMIVRENSEVLIEAFVYEKRDTDRQSTSLLKGALRSISGEIGKRTPKNVNYKAATATIGIRGTDIDVAIIGDGQVDRPGVYNYVRDGTTEVALASGERVLVEKEKAGFIPENPKPGEPLVQILDDRPAFLSNSGFDTLMKQLTNPRVPSIR